ncbi:MAG: YajQ family cyclic di-GMP-binding protein [Candidatus Eisenbacteria bacterium]|nr:YajQ family cyclic di-GMP-binding protein [Candidatus Eisenbacteria bacterium]
MANESSFDVVSRVDLQELKNAVQQAQKEMSQRFDFKASASSIELAEEEKLVLVSDDEHKLKSVVDIVQGKLIKRGISLKCMDYGPVVPAQKGTVRQEITLASGLEGELAREIVKDIKGLKLKVQAAIQEDQVRVSGKVKDDLQQVIAFLKAREYKLPLQFVNFR